MRNVVCVAVMTCALTGFAQGDERPSPISKPLELSDGWGTIEGQFILEGDVPAPAPPLQLPAGIPVPNERLLIDAKTKGIANIVVYLRKSPPTIHPELKQSKVEVVEFHADAFRFKPHVLTVRTDQQVRCSSADGRDYHLRTSPFSNPGYNLMMGRAYGSQLVQMRQSERIPVNVMSDVHPWMQAYWVVTDHPYVAVTDKEGRFRMEGLPVGKHAFTVWQERAGYIDRQWTIEVPNQKSLTLPAVKVPISKFKAH